MSIKNIIVNGSELNTNRIAQIKQFIKAIAANSSINPQRVSSHLGDNRIVFCVTDSTRITDFGQFDSNSDINERFKTNNPRFTASYHEIWNKVVVSKQDYRLKRIYFHLYLAEEDKEYILLHTDPTDDDITHGRYKRSPHLHIKHSNDDIITHAHLALNINDYDLALSSLEEVNKCFRNHIDMLSHQILGIR